MTNSSALDQLLRHLFRPIAKFCLRHGMNIQAAEDNFRQALIEVAVETMEADGIKVNVSRLCAMSGLYRNEISKRLQRQSGEMPQKMSISARVVSHWENDPRFRTQAGVPRILTYRGPNTEFETLVRLVSRHVGHAAVLLEMERNEIVQKNARGVKLIKGGNVFQGNAPSTFNLVARDIDALIRAAEGNLTRGSSAGNIHVRTEYDNIYERDLPVIRSWLVAEGKRFHKRVRDFLTKYDKDLNPKAAGPAGAKVVLGTFSLAESATVGEENKHSQQT